MSTTTSASAFTGSSSVRSRSMACCQPLPRLEQRVAAPGPLVAADEHLGAGVEEQLTHPVAGAPKAAEARA